MSHTTVIQNWVVRVQNGDAAARKELLCCACDRLLALTRKMKQDFPRVARWEETDDVLQSALLRLHRALEQVEIQDARHFLRLAATQIRRELIDLSRKYHGPEGIGRHHDSVAKRVRKSDQDTSPALQEPQDDTFDPQQLQSWSELHEAVERLPPEQREVFDLLWYHGLAQSEIADLLGVTTRTVKRRWREARLALFAALQGEPPLGV